MLVGVWRSSSVLLCFSIELVSILSVTRKQRICHKEVRGPENIAKKDTWNEEGNITYQIHFNIAGKAVVYSRFQLLHLHQTNLPRLRTRLLAFG